MTPFICTLGQALYGPHWVKPLASALGVSERTMRYWAAGEREPPPGIWIDAVKLCHEHRETLANLIGTLGAKSA